MISGQQFGTKIPPDVFYAAKPAYFFFSWAANVCATISPSRITNVSVAKATL